MGEPTPISLGVRDNPARNSQAGAARLINVYAEETEAEGKVVWTLYGTPGLVAFGGPLAGGSVRAMITVGTTLYVVAGRSVYAITSSGAQTSLGGIPTDGPVFMEQNRRTPPQIGIVSDGLFFVIDTTANSLTQIIDPDLPAPISLSVLDGYGILPIAGGRFMLTSIDDFTQIDGLDEGTAEAYPDGIVRSAVLEQELILFGPTSIEWHSNTGAADFPFSRVHATEQGCLAANSVAKADTKERKTLLWVAPDHTVRQMSGYSSTVISTNELHKLIKELHQAGNIAQLKGIAWADAGHFSYALSCNAWTRVYDSARGLWREQQSYGLGRWRVSDVVRFGTQLVAGDYLTGQLYEMRDDAFDEDGQPLIAEIITPHVHAFPYRLAMNALYIDAARGVGRFSTVNYLAITEPKLMVSWSKDSGVSWSAERERSLHGIARSAKRLQPIYRLGAVGQHGVQFRFRVSAPVERVMISASLDLDRLSP